MGWSSGSSLVLAIDFQVSSHQRYLNVPNAMTPGQETWQWEAYNHGGLWTIRKRIKRNQTWILYKSNETEKSIIDLVLIQTTIMS